MSAEERSCTRVTESTGGAKLDRAVVFQQPANAVRSAACRVFVAMAAPLVLGVSPALPLAGAAEAGGGNANSKQAIDPNSNRPPADGGSPASELRLQFAPGSIKTAADAQRAP